VVITAERHLHKTEVTIPFYDHQLIGLGADADLFTSMSQALDKLEKQAVKTRDKWREKRRDTPDADGEAPAISPSQKATAKPNAKPARKEAARDVRIFPVNHHDRRKPMTLEEAVIELQSDASLTYMVYRDADKQCVSVLVRRQDGHFDLIES
jgi:putative sigma-54 modulation protein